MIWVICIASYLLIGCVVSVLNITLDRDYNYNHSSDPMLVFILGFWWPFTLIMIVGRCIGAAEIKAAMKIRNKAKKKDFQNKT